jgi:hypothetical protein
LRGFRSITVGNNDSIPLILIKSSLSHTCMGNSSMQVWGGARANPDGVGSIYITRSTQKPHKGVTLIDTLVRLLTDGVI